MTRNMRSRIFGRTCRWWLLVVSALFSVGRQSTVWAWAGTVGDRVTPASTVARHRKIARSNWNGNGQEPSTTHSLPVTSCNRNLATLARRAVICSVWQGTMSEELASSVLVSSAEDYDIELPSGPSIAIIALVLFVAAQTFINQMLSGDQGLGAYLSDGKGFQRSGFRPVSSGQTTTNERAVANDPLPWLKLPKLDFVEVAGQTNDNRLTTTNLETIEPTLVQNVEQSTKETRSNKEKVAIKRSKSESLGGKSRSLLPFNSTAPNLSPPPIVYTIAGSDSGGGAGIQADLHAMHAFGCHGCSAITCLTAQNSVGVTQVHTPPMDFLQAQLDVLTDDLPPQAIKIGMLGTKDLVLRVAKFVQNLRQKEGGDKIWIVLDPVMISTSGHRLIEKDAREAMVKELFPYVDIVTPNKFEAEALLSGGDGNEQRLLKSITDVQQGAKDILDMGARAVLVKGGHVLSSSDGDDSDNPTKQYAQDYFLSRGDVPEEPRLCDSTVGVGGVWIESPRYDTDNTHGTGCTLSSSIASALALGEASRQRQGVGGGALNAMDCVDACCLAKAYVTAGIERGVQLGQGPGPVVHTTFPSTSQHFPSIVQDLTSLQKSKAFLPMKAFASAQDTTDERPTLGRILPIVDSVEWVERLCQINKDSTNTATIDDLQLRIKGETDQQRILEIVKQCQSLCQDAGIRLWVNDFWQAAVEAGCFGVHVGQEDLVKCQNAGGLEILRDRGIALGISTHSYGELAAALGVQPSYISLGPVFATGSKNVQFDPQGLQTVGQWRKLVPADMPLVAIGGIGDVSTAEWVKEAGADCVAVIGAVTSVSDPVTSIEELNKAMTVS